MEVPVHNIAGETVSKIDIADSIFDVEFNQAIVHQAVVRQLANARQGTASTKTRSEVAGSSVKLFRQKGTGHARAGSITSPLRAGGGIVFGPRPRSYRQSMLKKMRRLALRCALSSKVKDEEFMVLDDLKLEQPKTKQIVSMLAALETDSPVLLVTSEPETNVIKSARNIPYVKTMPASLLNVVDILSCKMLLMTVGAIRKTEELWGEKAS